jgi:hypothetical protein
MASYAYLVKTLLPAWKNSYDEGDRAIDMADAEMRGMLAQLPSSHKVCYVHEDPMEGFEENDAETGETYSFRECTVFTVKDGVYHVWFLNCTNMNGFVRYYSDKTVKLDSLTHKDYMEELLLDVLVGRHNQTIDFRAWAQAVYQTHQLWEGGLWEKCYEPKRIERILEVGGMNAVLNYLELD